MDGWHHLEEDVVALGEAHDKDEEDGHEPGEEGGFRYFDLGILTWRRGWFLGILGNIIRPDDVLSKHSVDHDHHGTDKFETPGLKMLSAEDDVVIT